MGCNFIQSRCFGYFRVTPKQTQVSTFFNAPYMEVVTQPPSPARGNNIEARNICDTYSMIREKEGKKRGEEKKKKNTKDLYARYFNENNVFNSHFIRSDLINKHTRVQKKGKKEKENRV